MNQDLSKIRTCKNDFPALARLHQGRTLVHLDGPAGVQVPQTVIDAISHYYRQSNSNTHGYFVTARETDEVVMNAREKMAAMLGAEGPHTISFGQNMTSLNFSLSKAIGRTLQSGDEVLITQLDHEANRGPWLSLREQGIIVREVGIKEDGTLDYDDFERKINEKTRLVAMGYASNAFGTVNDVEKIRQWTYRAGAWLLIDAVHYTPHFPMDVMQLGCDFLLCSAYKFYGPHVGILYSKPDLLDRLQPDRLRTQSQQAPYVIETGTLNHAALAGVGAAVDYIASFGEGETMREKTVQAMQLIRAHEQQLGKQLYDQLSLLPALEVIGPAFGDHLRAPTLAFTMKDQRPEQICAALAEKGVCAWQGHFYAIRPMEVLGLWEKGGVVRLGISMYNTKEEIDYTSHTIKQLS